MWEAVRGVRDVAPAALLRASMGHGEEARAGARGEYGRIMEARDACAWGRQLGGRHRRGVAIVSNDVGGLGGWARLSARAEAFESYVRRGVAGRSSGAQVQVAPAAAGLRRTHRIAPAHSCASGVLVAGIGRPRARGVRSNGARVPVCAWCTCMPASRRHAARARRRVRSRCPVDSLATCQVAARHRARNLEIIIV